RSVPSLPKAAAAAAAVRPTNRGRTAAAVVAAPLELLAVPVRKAKGLPAGPPSRQRTTTSVVAAVVRLASVRILKVAAAQAAAAKAATDSRLAILDLAALSARVLLRPLVVVVAAV